MVTENALIPNSRHAAVAFRLTGLLVCAVLLIGGCDTVFPTTDPHDNQLPIARLADNMPVPGDTLPFSLVTLHWDGGDPDGFVTSFEYRIFTKYCGASACEPPQYVDSTSRSWEGWEPVAFDDSVGWTSTKATSQTIVFNSRDLLNQQLFQVRTIDNSGALSEPSAASSRFFFTPNSVPPVVQIAEPSNRSQYFALDETNDWWKGIRFIYTGEVGNPEKKIVEYGWRLDDEQDWRWTRDTSIVIGPDAFLRTGRLEGEHTIHLTARDNTNLFAHEGQGSDSVVVELVRPTFDRRLIIVDETDERAAGGYILTTDEVVDSVYAAAFEPDAEWDLSQQGMPPREVLGQYEIVFWHADNFYAVEPHDLPAQSHVIRDYLDVGGNLILSGARMLASFTGSGVRLPSAPDGAGAPFERESFVHKYMHIAAAKETPPIAFDAAMLMSGAAGLGRFSDVSVDGKKLQGFPFHGTIGRGSNAREVAGLLQVNVISERASFTEAIYTFRGAGATEWAGQTVAIKYFGTVFDAVTFGFPLWFLRDEDINTVAKEVLRGFN